MHICLVAVLVVNPVTSKRFGIMSLNCKNSNLHQSKIVRNCRFQLFWVPWSNASASGSSFWEKNQDSRKLTRNITHACYLRLYHFCQIFVNSCTKIHIIWPLNDFNDEKYANGKLTFGQPLNCCIFTGATFHLAGNSACHQVQKFFFHTTWRLCNVISVNFFQNET